MVASSRRSLYPCILTQARIQISIRVTEHSPSILQRMLLRLRHQARRLRVRNGLCLRRHRGPINTQSPIPSIVCSDGVQARDVLVTLRFLLRRLRSLLSKPFDFVDSERFTLGSVSIDGSRCRMGRRSRKRRGRRRARYGCIDGSRVGCRCSSRKRSSRASTKERSSQTGTVARCR